MIRFKKGPNVVVSMSPTGPTLVGTLCLQDVMAKLAKIAALDEKSRRFYKKIDCESLATQVNELRHVDDHTGFITIEFNGVSHTSHSEALMLLEGLIN